MVSIDMWHVTGLIPRQTSTPHVEGNAGFLEAGFGTAEMICCPLRPFCRQHTQSELNLSLLHNAVSVVPRRLPPPV
jgi:hypothetical protein